MLKRLPREGRCRSVLLALGLLAGNLLFFLTIWMASKYDNVTLDQFIYQMKSSAELKMERFAPAAEDFI